MIERDSSPIDPSSLGERIRVALVAPHPVQRTLLLHTVCAHTDLDIVGVTADGEETLRLCPHIRPDVVAIDPRGAGTDGQTLAALIQSRWPWVQVLVLGNLADAPDGASAEAIKGTGFSSEGSPVPNVGAAIRALYARRNGAQGWTGSGPRLRAFPDQALSQREWDVWQALKMGLGDAQIGERLGVNELTARIHVRNVLDHLGLASRREVQVGDRPSQSRSHRIRAAAPAPIRHELAAPMRVASGDNGSRHWRALQTPGQRYH